MPITSPHPPVEVPDVGLTELVLGEALERGDRPALIEGETGRRVTYGELVESVEHVATGLTNRDFEPGDVFALFCPNVPEYAIAFHAVAKAGGVNTTINPLSTADELTRQLSHSRAKLLLTTPTFLDVALEASSRAGVQEVFVLGEGEGATPFADLFAESARAPTENALDPRSDVAVLPYSSGTTGWPKGVMLTHRNLVANLAQVAAVHDVSGDTVVGVLPFFHIYGMTVVMNLALWRGATIVTMARFDLERFLDIIQTHGVTRAHLVPPIILGLAKHPLVERFDLSSLANIMSGAAPLGPELADACSARLDCRVVQGYGLTEASPVTHLTPDEGANKPGSIGPALPNTECKVMDALGRELGPGETGEIWIRGPQVMIGYLNDPEATSATVDADGWLHTGDLGLADSDGYFFVVDRLKELIKYKGYQVAPAELEALLLTHPRIADAAVVASPDEEAGEVPKAFVVSSGEVEADEIMDFVAERVSPQKRVRRVAFVDQIPKSPSGKILRRLLVEEERSTEDAR